MREQWRLFTVAVVTGLVVALALRAGASGVPAPHGADPAPAVAEDGGLLLDLGNPTCPVMGNPVDGKTFAEWNHLRVGFCCPGCETRFHEDPEMSLDRTGVDWRAAHDAVQAWLDAPPEHRAHRLAAIRARWTVVRDPQEG